MRERDSGTINLNLVVWDGDPETAANLRRIAGHIAKIDGRIRVFVVPHHKFNQLALIPQWFAPNLSLSLYHVPGRKLLPGARCAKARVAVGAIFARPQGDANTAISERRLAAVAVSVRAENIIVRLFDR